MKRFKNILLLITDFDAKQQIAVERAVLLAQQNEAQLTVVSVIKELPPEMLIAVVAMHPQELLERAVDDCQESLDELVTDIHQQGVKIKSKVLTGTPFLEIIRQVLRDEHDLVILATEGKGSLKERLFGSTSMHLMRKCPCPVWVVKPSKRSSYKRILAAVDMSNDFPDFGELSLNPLILQLGSSLAQIDKSEFHIAQVWSVFAESYMQARGGVSKELILEMRQQTKQQYLSRLDHLLTDIELKGVTLYKHFPRKDNVPKAVIKLVKSQKIDLLVMGTVCRTGVAGFFIGNTAEKVLSELSCSVLTVKPEGFVSPVTLDDK